MRRLFLALMVLTMISCKEDRKTAPNSTRFVIESVKQEWDFYGKYYYYITYEGGNRFHFHTNERYTIGDTLVFIPLNALRAKEDTIRKLTIKVMNM